MNVAILISGHFSAVPVGTAAEQGPVGKLAGKGFGVDLEEVWQGWVRGLGSAAEERSGPSLADLSTQKSECSGFSSIT